MAEETNQQTTPQAPPDGTSQASGSVDIVKEAFGERAKPAETNDTAKGTAEEKPSQTPKANGQPQQAAAPPKGSREQNRVQKLLAEVEAQRKKIEELTAQAEKNGKEDVNAAVERKLAEYRMQEAQKQLETSAYDRFMDAFPDEASQNRFKELAAAYMDTMLEKAPQASEYISKSDISFKLEGAFYDICESNSTALSEFLSFPYPTQLAKLRELEAFLRSGSKPADVQTQKRMEPPSTKTITPSESGEGSTSPTGKSLFQKTLENIQRDNG